jgi:hypothetical protein
MNFTYLFDPEQPDPDQQILEKLDFLVVIFLLSEARRELVLDEAGARMKAARNAGCWVVTREHLDAAPRSSVLRTLDQALRSHPIYSNTVDHNFIAWIRRSDFVRGETERVQFVQLELEQAADDDARASAVRNAISKVLDESEKASEKPAQDTALLKLFSLALIEVAKRLFAIH